MWLQGSGVQVVVSRGLRRARGVMVRGKVREVNDGTAEESFDRRLHESTRRNRAIDPTHPFPSSTDAPELRRSPGGEAASEASGRLARIAAELEQVAAGASDPVVVGGVERLPTGVLRQHPQAQEGDVVEMHDVWLGLRDEFLVGPVHTLRLPRQEAGKRLQAPVPTSDRVKMS